MRTVGTKMGFIMTGIFILFFDNEVCFNDIIITDGKGKTIFVGRRDLVIQCVFPEVTV